jgi:hypothetical protein
LEIYPLAFKLFGLLVMPFWMAMIFLPRWAVTRKVMQSLWTVGLFALPYTLLQIPFYASALPLFLRPELDKIQQLLGTPTGATQAWLHFIAVDLFAGRWIYLDSRERDISVWIMGPILFLMAMFGPAGLVLYLLVRAAHARSQPNTQADAADKTP